MGQQQLILLVLATVIVGLAIVVGIRAFTENSAKSNADAMMQDAVRVANDLQAWKKKPAPFGGQAAVAPASVADPADFTGATWANLGYTDQDGNAATYTNLNGVFTLAPGAGVTTITGNNPTELNDIQVDVCGVTDRNIADAIITLSGQATANPAPACVPG